MNQVQQFFEYIFKAFKIWVIIQPWESALIIRNGKRIRKVDGGIYFKLPYFDSVYCQETRLRVNDLALQTITTKDGKTITIGGNVGYEVSDIQKLYSTLHQPEQTIDNFVKSEISEFINSRNREDIVYSDIEKTVLSKIKELDYGITFKYFKLNTFAVVSTYRLIQDQNWTDNHLRMDNKK